MSNRNSNGGLPGSYSSSFTTEKNRNSGLSVGEATVVGLGAFLLVLLLGAVVALISGFVLMLVMGALHNSVSEQIPAIGYWTAVLVSFAIRFISGLLFGGLQSTSSS